MKKILSILLIVFLTVGLVACSDKPKENKDLEKSPKGENEVVDPVESTATIYFGTEEGYLRAETVIIEGELTADKGQELIEKIIAGTSNEDTLNVLPQGLQVLNYHFDEETGIATIDFSEHIFAVAGSMGESLAVYSVVNTLTELPGVEKVQFLVEGEKVEQIGGHIYMADPLEAEPHLLEGNTLK
ncbi:MAG: GerMN domain-containing protein [Clostridia bacterium]|jgi:spore germination protein GerM|nr:GerMN domain-containing protein [Clostridia bacterium]